jgi:hypothetical protein
LGFAYRLSGSGTRTVSVGQSRAAEFANQGGPISDPPAANLPGGFDLAVCQQVMGLPLVKADNAAYFVGTPQEVAGLGVLIVDR